jgi:DNA-binding SARP family transcriptional activator/Tol biopolymer transport system component
VIELRTLGELGLRDATGREVAALLRRPKRVAVLAYLATALPRGFHHRDVLLALFWPDLDLEHARNALGQTLHVLRQSLGADVIVSRGTQDVGVCRDRLWCDAVAFDDDVRSEDHDGVLDLYRGDFLAGLHISGCPEFEAWVEDERTRLRRQAVEAALGYARRCEERGELGRAVGFAQMALRLDPYSEPTLTRLLLLMAHGGNRAEALRTFRTFEQRLRHDLELPPSDQLERLVAAITNGDAIGSTTTPQPPAGPALATAVTPARPVRRRRSAPRLAAMALPAVALAGVAAAILQREERGDTPTPLHRQVTYRGDVYNAAISPDGRSLAFLGGHPPSSITLFARDVTGGPTLALLTMTRTQKVTWSADGSYLYFNGCTGVSCGNFRLPHLGGEAQVVESMGSAAWAPDGVRFAVWIRGIPRIWTWNRLDGDSAVYDLEGDIQFVDGADWSPTADVIALTTMAGGRSTLRGIAADGSWQGVLLEEVGPVEFVHWSPTGRALYYLALTSAFTAELRRLPVTRNARAAEGAPTVLLTGLEVKGTSYARPAVSVSADGTRLVYTRFQARSNLWRIQPPARHGEAPASLSPLTSGTAIRRAPAASPDGAWIAFVQVGEEGADLWKMPAGGGPATRLTFLGTLYPGMAAWSPDGGQLAFSAGGAEAPRLWLIDAAGGEARPITGVETSATGYMTWTASGLIIHQAPGNRNLIALDPATGRQRKLLQDESGFVFMPRASPDGRMIAFNWNRRDEAGVWVSPVDHGAPQYLAPGHPLGWSPDGRGIIYGRAGSREFRLAPVPSGSGRVVGQLPFDFADILYPGCDVHVAGARWHLVCAREERSSDAWMVENFDPAARRSERPRVALAR